MIKVGTMVKVVDNTGAKTARCLKVQPGYKRDHVAMGDIIVVSIQSLRTKRRDAIKLKRGEIYKALVLRVKFRKFLFSGDSFFYNEMPSVILLTKQKKILGTRVFGSTPKLFRFSNYLKIMSLSYGIHSL